MPNLSQHLKSLSTPWVLHPFADLKLGIWVPGYSDPQQPFIIKWSDDQRLCRILWELFQHPENLKRGQTLLTPADIKVLQHMGLLLPFSKLSVRGVRQTSEPLTYLQTYQPASEKPDHWLLFNFQARLQVEVDVPLRHRHVRAQLFDWERQPEICQLAWRFFAKPNAQFNVQERQLLQQMGLICPADWVPEKVLYAPDLSAKNALRPYASRPAQLPLAVQVNTRCAWQEGPDLPAAVELPFISERIQQQPPLLWVQDPRNHIWTPLSVSDTDIPRLKALFQEALKPADLSPAETQSWLDAGILLPDPLPLTVALQQQLQQQDFCVIPGLLNPLQITAARIYLRRLHAEGYLLNGDPFVSNRFGMHNEPLCRFFHQQFYPVISEITQTPLKPSYCYFALYHSGARLPRHTDREQCAWNVSLVLDTEPEQTREQAWPIYLELPQGVEEVRLEMGDAILYRGSRYPHWRNPLASGARVSVCFFHFVDADFEGLLF